MSQQVEIRLSSEQVQLEPGSYIDLSVTLANISGSVDTFSLGISDLPPGWAQLGQLEMLLYPEAPGNEGTTFLRLNIPPEVAPGAYAARVMATSANQPENSVTRPLVVFINEVKKVAHEIVLQPDSLLTKRKEAYFQVQVKNYLNKPAILKLYARPNLAGPIMTINPPQINLEPSGQALSTLEVRLAKRNLVGSNRHIDFNVGIEGANEETHGTLVQSATLPWLRAIVVSPFLLLLALLLPIILIAVLAFWLWPTSSAANNTPTTVAACVPVNNSLAATLQMRDSTTEIIVSQPDGSRARKIGTEPTDRLPGLFSSLLSISPDGRNLAYVTAKNEALDDAAIFTINLTSQSKQRVTGISTGLWIARPVWSADSSRISYVMRNGSQLELWETSVSAADRKPRLVGAPRALIPDLYYRDPGITGPVCWSTDSTRLIILPKATPTKQVEVNLSDGKDREAPRTSVVAGSEPPLVTQRLLQTGLKEPPLAPAGDGDCFVNTFSQNDPQWRAQQLGSAGDKIGDAGCTITAAAMLLNHFKVDTDPDQLNTCLGPDANPFNWVLPATRCSQNGVQGGTRAEFTWSALDNALKSGQPAVVGFLGGQTGTHYVVVVGGSDSIASSYRVNDPWDGSNYKSMAYFISRGYQLKWIVPYNPANGSPCPTRVDPAQKFQPGFTLITPEDGGLYKQPVTFQYNADPGVPISTTLNVWKAPVINQDGTQTAAESQTVQTDLLNGQSLNNEGAYTLVLESASDPTNKSRQTAYFVVDFTPPRLELVRPRVTDFDPIATPDAPLISRTKVSLELKAGDSLSGVALIEYRVNGGDWLPYSNDTNLHPVAFEKPGDYLILYRATDGAGNRTQEGSLKFTITLATAAAGNTQTGGTNGQGGTTANPNDPNAAGGAGGGANGAANATPTTSAQPGVLTAAPSLISFDANTNQASVQLTNAGPGAVVWSIQPLQGVAATSLKLAQTSGTIPPGSGAALAVSLTAFNFSIAPQTANITIVYNDGAASLPIVVTIAPQPTPTVQFISPAVGPLSGKSVDVHILVVPTGLARPNHASFTAKYTTVAGGAPVELPIPGQGNQGNDWGVPWDISALPPQSPIEINGKICWTSDESACAKINPPLAGLSISKPVVNIALDPNSDKLVGTVTISAQVQGILDHITYAYTYKENGSDVTKTLEKATGGNNYTIKWNTTAIPPQTGIKLDIKVCWGTDDNPLNCGQPANQPPTSFTVEPPALTANPLSAADAASLPATIALGGNASKIGGANTVVFVNYKFLPTVGGTLTEVNAPATLGTLSSGSAPWSLSIDSSTWPPQQITFTPKICWDGNATGLYCYPVTTPLVGTIPELNAIFVAPIPTDLSTAPLLKVAGTPTTRVTSIKYLVSYTANDNSAKTDVQLNTDANVANSFAVKFDSAALGLRPGQTVTIKIKACNSGGYCGPPGTTPITWAVPDATLTFAGPVPNPLTASVPMTATVAGRGASTVTFLAYYRTNPITPTPVISAAVGTPVSNVTVSQVINFNWNTAAIPPQTGIRLAYRVCWGAGELDTQGCTENDASTADYTNLTIPAPVVTGVRINGGTVNYNVANTLPIAYSNTAPLPTITVPLTATIGTGTANAVKWQLSVNPTPANPLPITPLAAVQVDTTNHAFANVPIDLQLLAAAGVNLDTDVIVLTAVPVWTNPVLGGDLDYSATANTLVLNIQLISMQVVMETGNRSVPNTSTGTFKQLAPPPTVAATTAQMVMMGKVTYFTVTMSAANAPLVDRILFDVTYLPSATATQTVTSTLPYVLNPSAAPPGNFSGTIGWDHTSAGFQIPPQANVTLSWRLCTTASPNNSGCQSSAITGSINKITGLTLGAARFVASGDLATVSPNTFLESSFNAVVEVTAPSAVKQIRLIAYPTADFATPVVGHAVILKTRLTEVVSGTTWTLPTLWPDDPPTGPTPLATTSTVANFITKVANNNITLSIQYCTDPNPALAISSSTCSAWHGQDFANFNTLWPGTKNAKQGVIVTWQSYAAEPDPHDSFIKENVGAAPGTPTNTRTLRVKVLPVTGTTTVQGVTFSFLAPAVNANPQLIGSGVVATNIWSVSPAWSTAGIGFTVDTSTNWSVTLIVNVSFVTTSGTFANDTKLATHGVKTGYTGT